jgi:DNA primase
MRHRGVDFPKAIRWLGELAGIAVPSMPPSRPRPSARSGPARPPVPTDAGPPVRAADGPTGLSPADALALVEEAEQRLWSPEGLAAMAYLEGRGLTPDMIRRHRLGWMPRVTLPTSDGARTWEARGVVIPWFDGDHLAKVEIRQPDGREPRYAQAFADRPRVYPGPEAIRPGMPLIVVEGAFEAMLLGQELGDLASVITTGSASTEIDPSLLPALLRCPQWYAAQDADSGGDKAAAKWPSRAVRVRPPRSGQGLD